LPNQVIYKTVWVFGNLSWCVVWNLKCLILRWWLNKIAIIKTCLINILKESSLLFFVVEFFIMLIFNILVTWKRDFWTSVICTTKYIGNNFGVWSSLSWCDVWIMQCLIFPSWIEQTSNRTYRTNPKFKVIVSSVLFVCSFMFIFSILVTWKSNFWTSFILTKHKI